MSTRRSKNKTSFPSPDEERVPVSVSAPPQEEKITFHMYCARKGVVSRHQPGMRAYTDLQHAS